MNHCNNQQSSSSSSSSGTIIASNDRMVHPTLLPQLDRLLVVTGIQLTVTNAIINLRLKICLKIKVPKIFTKDTCGNVSVGGASVWWQDLLLFLSRVISQSNIFISTLLFTIFLPFNTNIFFVINHIIWWRENRKI